MLLGNFIFLFYNQINKRRSDVPCHQNRIRQLFASCLKPIISKTQRYWTSYLHPIMLTISFNYEIWKVSNNSILKFTRAFPIPTRPLRISSVKGTRCRLVLQLRGHTRVNIVDQPRQAKSLRLPLLTFGVQSIARLMEVGEYMICWIYTNNSILSNTKNFQKFRNCFNLPSRIEDESIWIYKVVLRLGVRFKRLRISVLFLFFQRF